MAGFILERKTKKGLCPTLTANMGTGGHNKPIMLRGSKKSKKITNSTSALILQDAF